MKTAKYKTQTGSKSPRPCCFRPTMLGIGLASLVLALLLTMVTVIDAAAADYKRQRRSKLSALHTDPGPSHGSDQHQPVHPVAVPITRTVALIPAPQSDKLGVTFTVDSTGTGVVVENVSADVALSSDIRSGDRVLSLAGHQLSDQEHPERALSAALATIAQALDARSRRQGGGDSRPPSVLLELAHSGLHSSVPAIGNSRSDAGIQQINRSPTEVPNNKL